VLLHEIVEFAASDRPDDVALISDGRRPSFAQLDQRIRAVADVVGSRTRAGDRVVIVSDNHLDVVTAMYAVPRAGAILTFANTRHTPAEINELIDATVPSMLLASPEQLDRLGPVLNDNGSLATVLSIGGAHPVAEDDLTELADNSIGNTSEPAGLPTGLAEAHGTGEQQRVPELDACAWLIHTSGTTGRPKGVMLTHRSLVAGVTNTAISRPFSEDDVYLFPFPLFHVAAYNVLHAHLRRRPVVLVPRFDAATVLGLIRSEQVTCCSLAPTMLAMLLDHPERTPTSLEGLRQISYGASAMPLDLLRRVLSELPDCGLAQGYGMTELSGNAVFLTPDDHRRAADQAPHLLSAAGRPGPLVGLRIVDDHDADVEAGDAGEILVRGDQVCAGYWQDPAATEASRLGPWLRTGDIGRLVDGVLHVVDRKKDLIITGGENVASREVEDLLSTHPAVGQVAVVGLPDTRWGETVCAAIVPADVIERFDPDELIRWTDGRLAGFKRPRRVVVVDQLPLNASGKVDKALVRAQVLRASGGSA